MASPVPGIGILADDLTGALDSAVEFAGLCGPVEVGWNPGALPAGRARAFSSETRELALGPALERLAVAMPVLAGADLAFKKIDSLLRGHAAAEIGFVHRVGNFSYSIVAPAFPAQGRVTRDGVQYVRALDPGSGWQAVHPGFVEELRGCGVAVRTGGLDIIRSGGDGIVVCDAATDRDLAAIVAAGRKLAGPALWCGAGGLAAALAGCAPPDAPALPLPCLVVVGSAHPVSVAQVAYLRDAGIAAEIVIGAARPHETRHELVRLLRRSEPVLVTFRFAAEVDPRHAADSIRAALGALLADVPPPGSLVVTGGETLIAVCTTLGARAICTDSRVRPGVAHGHLVGGAWGGVAVVSKSGAFADSRFFLDLLQGPV